MTGHLVIYWVNFRKKYPDIHIMGAAIGVSAETEHGTAEDVTNRVKENIMKLVPLKRFIVCPLCCMPWRVPLGNMHAVLEAVEKYGRYSIKVS